MVAKLGTLGHAKGFVVDKLRKQARFGGTHVPVMFLSEGYPPKWRHLITQAVDVLKSKGIVRIEKKRTGRDSAPHATLTKNALAKKGVRGLLNAYRRAEKLPTLGRDLRTLLPVRRRGSAPPTRGRE